MTAYQLLLNQSELRVPAGTASIIVAAAPFVSVAVARVLFDERITPFTMVGSAVALAGVAIVCLARAGLSLSASVWVVIAAMVVQGIYHPLQRPLLTKYTGLEVATYTMVAGTIMTLPFVPFGWSAVSRFVCRGVDLRHLSWSAAVGAGFRSVGLRHRPSAHRRVDVVALPCAACRRTHRLGMARRNPSSQ